jgi:excinuclease ABC subunit C
MKSQELVKLKLPDKPGIYFFYKDKEVIYIGKATSLRDRTKSYFAKDLVNTRGPSIVDMVFKSDTVKWQETDSVLEALILEAELIKKYQPYYNVKEKDDKSWNYVCITKEKIPKLLTVRGRNLEKGNYKKIFGPYTNGSQLREALKIIRRIFPYVDDNSNKKSNYQFYKQLKLVPEENYKNNIKNLILFFQGKKKQILKNLKKEMMTLAKAQKFEDADEIKRKVFALEHINDIALLKSELREDNNFLDKVFRIEAYDIAHMSGKNMVGVMTVVSNGRADKSEYKKFIIKTQTGSNDTGALEEILSRRFRHTEWGMPNLVVIDGGVGQLNVGERVLKRYQLDIPVVSVVKDDTHKAREISGDKNLREKYKKEIILANSESHRFAITFHKQKRNKSFLSS